MMLTRCLAPPFAALIEWLWLGTKLTGRQAAACAVILSGVALALAPGKHLNAKRSVLAAGICFCLLAGFGNGFGAVLIRKANEVAKAAQLEDQVVQTESEISADDVRVSKARSNLSQVAIAAYVSGGDESDLSMLLSSSTSSAG